MTDHSNAPLIVFDLDGTLVDSAPDLVDSLNAILGREGIPAFPLERARKFVGRGGRMMIRQGLDAAGATVSDNRLEEMFSAFLAHYEQHLSDKTRFYPGVEAALDRLQAEGHGLAICTNKFEKPSRMLIHDLGADARFRTICGQDTFPVFKPNPAMLRLTIEKAGGDATRAIMVGDTSTDIETAKGGRPSGDRRRLRLRARSRSRRSDPTASSATSTSWARRSPR